MGLFDSLFAEAVKAEVERQLADKLQAVEASAQSSAGLAAEARHLAANAAHTANLLSGAISTLDRKVTDMREQMQSDEDYTRKLALRVVAIEKTDGGIMPDADGG